MLKKTICKRHADVCKVFGNPLRIRIIEELVEQDRTTSELAEMLKVSQVNVSQALSMMRERNIVVSQRDGNIVHHSLADSRIRRVFYLMREMLLDNLERSGELAREARATLEPEQDADDKGIAILDT
ncbi:MAG: metalloregulator ArsR/SmtB family transcription factor [Candidatus Lernaella stagnicola]|nr:metalloregulator ArsR/SmtB family transcription factor [Candidatus Lernaella stagnicola]